MKRKRVVALGFFDGVHLGHGALLTRCRQVADRLDAQAAVMTFDLHPDTLVFGTPMPLLNTAADRTLLMKEIYGMDDVLFCHFDKAMMELPWREFVCDYLKDQLGAVAVVCGHDYHFGHRGQGNPQRLAELCHEMGMECHVIGKITLDEITVSSTHIRSLLRQGDMEQVNRFLGHSHILSGTVVHGRQLGRTMGTPTANLLLPDGILPPAFGVYACRVWVDETCYLAVTNVGVRPTVDGLGHTNVEAWLLDFDGDLYGQDIRVEFCKFLRPEQKFPSLEDLKKAIEENAAQTRAYFQTH